MSDITRDDLIEVGHAEVIEGGRRYMTRQKFDRLAREAGYYKRTDPFPDAGALGWVERHPGKALRALLTDECNHCDGVGGYALWVDQDEWTTCPGCGGRGWLPKDGVSEGWQWTTEGNREPSGDLIIPLDWLEAEDE